MAKKETGKKILYTEPEDYFPKELRDKFNQEKAAGTKKAVKPSGTKKTTKK